MDRAWECVNSPLCRHSLIDSLENIDYSLCTLEFEVRPGASARVSPTVKYSALLPLLQVRRELYYWVLEALGRFRPTVWEFSRLNITRTVLSKARVPVRSFGLGYPQVSGSAPFACLHCSARSSSS